MDSCVEAARPMRGTGKPVFGGERGRARQRAGPLYAGGRQRAVTRSPAYDSDVRRRSRTAGPGGGPRAMTDYCSSSSTITWMLRCTPAAAGAS